MNGLDKVKEVMIESDSVLAKKSKHDDKGNGVMIEYDSVLAKKIKHVSRGSGIFIRDVENMHLDVVIEHEESEDVIEEGVWLIKDLFKKDEWKTVEGVGMEQEMVAKCDSVLAKKSKHVNKGNGVMIEYDSVLAKKMKHVSRGSGIVIQDVEDINLDEVIEHEESEEGIEEGVC
ncbi:hypothetical protein Tco_0810705 [Tanacetum coccineum]